MKWLHSLAYIVWIGYFSKKVRDFIVEEELAPRSQNDTFNNGKVSSSSIQSCRHIVSEIKLLLGMMCRRNTYNYTL